MRKNIGDCFKITSLGYIDKSKVLNYITVYPRCYMSDIDSYKIDRKSQLESNFKL